jgi:hypothetical protein
LENLSLNNLKYQTRIIENLKNNIFFENFIQIHGKPTEMLGKCPENCENSKSYHKLS